MRLTRSQRLLHMISLQIIWTAGRSQVMISPKAMTCRPHRLLTIPVSMPRHLFTHISERPRMHPPSYPIQSRMTRTITSRHTNANASMKTTTKTILTMK
ncbi:uncharacterized protein LAESUDRAFT_318208 [Laetiporus sulphureus 93-53]|uniref:Secreted protein n=1 Tax=Laetiporus sulphureus 93-53 TaxID=1314785 RepID=A0A165D106_9APHY|nr:uncharacterized protein LAESUDRAFT_318208 [Laetiporus sulphureus 93-53]KZT03918.1 hypothetical protein LAESUDRAFT_318208 [Laetiporus sulphureus 93-53]